MHQTVSKKVVFFVFYVFVFVVNIIVFVIATDFAVTVMSGILVAIVLIFVICIASSITLIVLNPRTIVSNVIDKP